MQANQEETNSKAFTAKTSCVRRRYREFVWLRKLLQKNAGLVPVPELPGKAPFFVGSSDEFVEKRRQGLQQFVEETLQNMVLLSDSRLHLFLQSQLSLAEIEACVQGQGPLTVSDAILGYAVSNQGWVQEEDPHSTAQVARGDDASRKSKRKLTPKTVHTRENQSELQEACKGMLWKMASDFPGY
ncbi:sorting nexin-11 isoform X2 [Microcaecilia unicolor]|uniref:Sorting nexin-11 isoform X2 n=1 Tax=Microcaecilia unicolor TaxID=1415580 RepID=A0A6P7ZAM2_9AMPH|nr:sorting nexin-11 isoform X2 [Microcaecilia unicolor]XP_030076373.1 sorting nexin-11 isoform X2 [Microcaecilia unicolor]XP_030076374.1 sorting nexin-11 isoform X2 [Microcaecilia unicolor]